MNDLDPNFFLPLWVSSESYERLRKESAGGPAGEAGSAAGKVTKSPSFFILVWNALVRYFRAYPPVVQAPQQLDLPLRKERRKTRLARGWFQLPKHIERRLPLQAEASSTAASAHAGKHGQYRPDIQGRVDGEVTQSPRSYLPKDLERRLPLQPSP